MSYSATEVILFLIGQALVAAGIWGGIRADIRNMHDRIQSATDRANEAHDRIDSIMTLNWKDHGVDRRV